MFNYKIVLIGDSGVGKSTYVERLRTNKFNEKYIATQGVDVFPLQFNTNYGVIVFKIWDCAGQEKFGGLKNGYYFGADGAIVMNQFGSDNSKQTALWIKNIRSVREKIPIIVCHNKCDIAKEDSFLQIKEDYYPNVEYCSISTLDGYNLNCPWLNLARQLTGYKNLEFQELPECTQCKTTQPECKQPESKQPECKQPESKQSESKQSESKQTECKQPESKQPETTQCKTTQTESTQTETTRTESTQSKEMRTTQFEVKHEIKKKVSWLSIPGGIMKVTYEFYKDGEVSQQEGNF